MEIVEIPVKVSWWKKYKGLVLYPPRDHELKKLLISKFNSGGMYYGFLKVVMFGESLRFKVGVKFYTWNYVNNQKSHGLNTIFVVSEANCHVCIGDIMEYVNEYGNANGVLTLYLP